MAFSNLFAHRVHSRALFEGVTPKKRMTPSLFSHISPKLTYCLIGAMVIAGCSGGPSYSPGKVKGAIPKEEPLSRSGNPETYEVFGTTYRLLPTTKGYKEEGYASWYGKKFHGKSTSSGTPYDMYAYTAAHKTLPIPSYVLVTNLENGKQLTLRVNDRGPFVKDRIIDLSYAAALELDVVQKGTAKVRVEALPPHQHLKNRRGTPKPSDDTPSQYALDKLKKESGIPEKSTATATPYTVPETTTASTNNVQAPIFPPNSEQEILEVQTFSNAPTGENLAQNQYANTPVFPAQTTPTQPQIVTPGIYIQLGSFSSELNAQNFSYNIQNQVQQPPQIFYQNGLYRVVIGSFASRYDASNTAAGITLPNTIVSF